MGDKAMFSPFTAATKLRIAGTLFSIWLNGQFSSSGRLDENETGLSRGAGATARSRADDGRKTDRS
jgi:hypothetical protein